MKRLLRRLLKLLGYALATIYFVADLVFESMARPLSAWLGRLRILQPLYAWIARLRPYPALALFSVPVVILEPVKPIGAFLVAAGHVVQGVIAIVAGEILKIALVERLFKLTRDRLLQIPAFAFLYRRWMQFHDWVTSSEIWRWSHARIAHIKALFRRAVATARGRRPDMAAASDAQADATDSDLADGARLKELSPSEVHTSSREENASKQESQESRAPVLIQSEPEL
jgi:hypothetical protein